MTFEPGGSYEYTLQREFGIANSIKFCFRHVSARESLRASKIRDKLIEESGIVSDESFEQLITAIAIGLKSFVSSNGETVDDLSTLVDCCSVRDLYELLNVVIYGPSVTADEKKRSE